MTGGSTIASPELIPHRQGLLRAWQSGPGGEAGEMARCYEDPQRRCLSAATLIDPGGYRMMADVANSKWAVSRAPNVRIIVALVVQRKAPESVK